MTPTAEEVAAQQSLPRVEPPAGKGCGGKKCNSDADCCSGFHCNYAGVCTDV